MTFFPSAVALTPLPGTILKLSAFIHSLLYSASKSLTMAFPRGCSECFSTEAASSNIFSSGISGISEYTCCTRGVPFVRVPVLSKVIFLTEESLSRASPSFTRKPCFVAFPMAAIIAVGVASTRAQGQKTTSMVTERIISPVTNQVITAALKAVTTIHVAHLSARLTIFALSASADWTSLIILCMELSSPTLTATISKEPN